MNGKAVVKFSAVFAYVLIENLEYLFEELHKLNLYQDKLSLEDMLKMEYLLPWNEKIKSMFKVKEVAR